MIDERGYVTIQGRVDDVMNVSGHRLGSIELESALVSHPRVAEAGVVGAPDPTTGQAVVAFVTVTDGPQEGLADELCRHVATVMGPVARPREVVIVGELPKTRSGKIMRRLLLDVTAGREPGDTTSLVDPAAFTELAAGYRP